MSYNLTTNMKTPKANRVSDRLMAVIDAHPELTEFCSLDLIKLAPEVLGIVDEEKQQAKSIAQAMNALIRAKKLYVTKRERVGDETFHRPFVKRGAQEWESNYKADEPESPVTREKLENGRTLVRFGQGWKPAHRSASTPGMFGYKSGLADLI